MKKGKSNKKINSSKKKNIYQNLLQIWLILLLIGNAFTAILCIIFNSYLITKFPHVPGKIFYILGLFAIGYVISVIALLKQKIWGFYLFLTISIIIPLINIFRGLDWFRTIIGLIPVIFLYFLLRKNNRI